MLDNSSIHILSFATWSLKTLESWSIQRLSSICSSSKDPASDSGASKWNEFTLMMDEIVGGWKWNCSLGGQWDGRCGWETCNEKSCTLAQRRHLKQRCFFFLDLWDFLLLIQCVLWISASLFSSQLPFPLLFIISFKNCVMLKSPMYKWKIKIQRY